MDSVSWIDQLKLRAGYGITGNAAIDPYTTIGAIASIYYPYGTSITQGYTLFDNMLFNRDDRSLPMANENLTWEKRPNTTPDLTSASSTDESAVCSTCTNRTRRTFS